MAHIVLLALGAAVFPLLLACVALILARPRPRRLLLAFYAGGLIVSLTAGLALLAAFHQGHHVAGNTSKAPDPSTSIVAGIVALALAAFMVRRPPRRPTGSGSPSWTERQLNRATPPITFVIGGAINLPGPFYLLALGDIARGGYSTAQSVGLVLLFNLIMFALIEVPLAGYLVRPEQTAVQVDRLGRWLNANALRVMGWLVAAAGLSLVVQGVAAAAS